MNRALIFILIFCCSNIAYSQLPGYYRQEKNNEGNVITINLLYGLHRPGGDFADRFGGYFSAGGGVDMVTGKDWIIGTQAYMMFGNEVSDDVIASLKGAEDGLIFGVNGDIADIQLRQRGLSVSGHIGRIFRLKEEGRSGIRVTLGAGLFQHKVRIQDDPIVDVPQLSKNYKKGYDRLTNGLGITQFVGYQHVGKLRRINFLAGFEFTQAFTQNRRSINFDTRMQETDNRLDLSFGFRVGWQLTLYVGENADELEY